MNVELPNTGCNILYSADTIYNYSDNNHTRSEYSIYSGEIFLRNTSTSTYGYNVTGTCLNTGDLVYKPEVKVYFEIISVIIFYLIVRLVFRLLRGKGL